MALTGDPTASQQLAAFEKAQGKLQEESGGPDWYGGTVSQIARQALEEYVGRVGR